MPPKQRNPGSQPFPRACLPLPTIPLNIRAAGEHRGKMQNSMTRTRKKRVAPAPKIDRQSRRKMETRRKLIRATVDVMAQKGPDATTIQDITETADVGFGSFYNYFKSKDEIRFAAMEELLDRFGSEIDQLANLIADPVEVFASSMRTAVKTLARRPEWADFLIRVGFDTHDHPRGLYPRMRRDLQIVFKSGRLAIDDPSAHGARRRRCFPVHAGGRATGRNPRCCRPATDHLGGLEASRLAGRGYSTPRRQAAAPGGERRLGSGNVSFDACAWIGWPSIRAATS